MFASYRHPVPTLVAGVCVALGLALAGNAAAEEAPPVVTDKEWELILTPFDDVFGLGDEFTARGEDAPPDGFAEFTDMLDPFDALIKATENDPATPIEWDDIFADFGDADIDTMGFASRGTFKIWGCTLHITNPNATKKCLDGKMARAKKDADKRVRNAQNQAQSAFNTQLRAAQAKAQQDLNRASQQATRYQSQLRAAQTELATVQRRMQQDANKAVAEAQRQANTATAAAQRQANQAVTAARRDAERSLNQVRAQLQRELQQKESMINTLRAEVAKGVTFDAPWQQEFVSSILGMRLNELFSCLEGEARQGKFDVVTAIEQFSQDPVGYAGTQVTDIVNSASSRFGQVVERELAAMDAGQSVPTNPDALIARAFDNLSFLSGSVDGAQCVFEFVRPELEANSRVVADVAMRAANQMKIEAEKAVRETIVPWIMDAVAEQVGPQLNNLLTLMDGSVRDELPPEVATLLPTDVEMKGIAREILFKRHVEKRFNTARTSMDAFLKSPSPTQGDRLVADLGGLVEGTEDYEALYMEIFAEAIRLIAHKWINSEQFPSHGGALVNDAVGVLNIGPETIHRIATALGGLVPEAGGAVVSVIEEVIEVVWNGKIIGGIHSLAQKLANGGVDLMVDTVETELLSGKTLAQIKATTGPSGRMLEAVPHEQAIALWAGTILKKEMKMMDDHFIYVKNLAEVAAATETES